MKYQFCIRFENTTTNSAATKAVSDCNVLFLNEGYKDYTITVWDNSQKLQYYMLLIKELARFYFSVKKGSVIAIQYPLLSINNVFGLFIKLARFKAAKFVCIVHDVESLRTGGKDEALIKKEIKNLNTFDCVIAHNPAMIKWMRMHGLTANTVSLGLFDYLARKKQVNQSSFDHTIAFAGNLTKSSFIYHLDEIKGWHFKCYGPNFLPSKATGNNMTWGGEYSPEEIVHNMQANFGLIWDGDRIDKCDDVLGNYLMYNNPHKFSLYLAAGLPVIAPASAAIAQLIRQYNIGLLIESLYDLNDLRIDEESYNKMRSNVQELSEKVTSGYFFKEALQSAQIALGGHLA